MTTWMPPVGFADVNGIRLAFYEAGPEKARPPIILCHGFPEIAFSWRHQIRGLSEQGFRVIAPDMRGYGLTDRPEPIEAYDIAALTGDLVGLLDWLEIDKAVFCGHDWGGAVVWQMGARHPDRVAGVIGLNTPYRQRGAIPPMAFMRQVFGDAYYMVQFQEPGPADALFAADVEKTVRYFLRRPDLDRPARTGTPESGRSVSLAMGLAKYDPKTDRNQFLSDAEIAVYVETFTRTGYTGGLNWYRNLDRNWALGEGVADHVAAPALMIMAEHDAVLPPSAADGMERYVPHLTKALVRDSGHWTQQEQPERVTALIAEWMRTTVLG